MKTASISAAPASATRWRADLSACLFLGGVVAAWDALGLDLPLMRLIGGHAGFALQHQWFVSGVLHSGGRALGWIVFATLALGLWRPLPGLRSLERRDLAGVLLSALLCVALIDALKAQSLTSCPWSLAEFGGSARYVSHWALGLHDGGAGGCFPSGHASTAFAFLGLGVALRERRPRLARSVFGAIVASGALLGLAQTLRGAHYPSHTLWTAWLCLALSLALHHARLAMR